MSENMVNMLIDRWINKWRDKQIENGQIGRKWIDMVT